MLGRSSSKILSCANDGVAARERASLCLNLPSTSYPKSGLDVQKRPKAPIFKRQRLDNPSWWAFRVFFVFLVLGSGWKRRGSLWHKGFRGVGARRVRGAAG